MGVDAPEVAAADSETGRVAGVRLYTRAPVTLAWLSRSVLPVARALSDRGRVLVHLRRGWLHGPHVDVVALGVREDGRTWPDIAARLDAGPIDPAKALTEEAYLAQAREFGRLEAVPPPYLPMREHGEVEYLGRSHVGSREPKLDPLQEIVLGVLCAPLMDTIDELARHPARATVRLAEAFLALADTHVLGPEYGAFSFHSHAEAFLAWAAPTKDVRPAFEARRAKEATELRTVVRQRISGEATPAAAAWRTAFAYCAGALDCAVAGDTLTSAMLESVTATDLTGMGPPGAPDMVPRGDRPDSAFHEAVAESGVVAEPPKWFAAYRLLVNLFYQQLPLLTVSPLQRYYMCYAIAETIDEVLGESWQDRLRREQARVAGGPPGRAPRDLVGR